MDHLFYGASLLSVLMNIMKAASEILLSRLAILRLNNKHFSQHSLYINNLKFIICGVVITINNRSLSLIKFFSQFNTINSKTLHMCRTRITKIQNTRIQTCHNSSPIRNLISSKHIIFARIIKN